MNSIKHEIEAGESDLNAEIRWVTYRYLSKYLDISIGALRNMVYRKQLKPVRIGRRVRFDILEITSCFKNSNSTSDFNLLKKISHKQTGTNMNIRERNEFHGQKIRSRYKNMDSVALNEAARRWRSYISEKEKYKIGKGGKTNIK